MSDMSNWLKAGLIGAAVLVALNVVECIPGAVCCTWLPEWVTLGCVGALAAYWMAPPRMAGAGAGQGALAGLIAAAIGGVVGVVLGVVQSSVFGAEQFLSQVDPYTLRDMQREMQRVGVDPSTFMGPVGSAAFGSICCGVGLVIAAGLGALGGLIFAAMRPGEPGAGPV
jgi:hypothetical protein